MAVAGGARYSVMQCASAKIHAKTMQQRCMYTANVSVPRCGYSKYRSGEPCSKSMAYDARPIHCSAVPMHRQDSCNAAREMRCGKLEAR